MRARYPGKGRMCLTNIKDADKKRKMWMFHAVKMKSDVVKLECNERVRDVKEF